MPPIASPNQNPAPSPALARPGEDRERKTLTAAFIGSLLVNLLSVAVLGYVRYLTPPPPVALEAKKPPLAVGVYRVPRAQPTPVPLPPVAGMNSGGKVGGAKTGAKASGTVQRANATRVASTAATATGATRKTATGKAGGSAATNAKAGVGATSGAAGTTAKTGDAQTRGAATLRATATTTAKTGNTAANRTDDANTGKTEGGKPTDGTTPGIAREAASGTGATRAAQSRKETATLAALPTDAPGSQTERELGAASTRDGSDGEAAPASKNGEKGKGRYVVPQVAKMWAVSPGQKLVLPDGMKLELPPNLPVVPGSAFLTEDQLAQLRKLLLSQNLRQMRGLTKEQLKKMLAARKDTERPRSATALASAAQPTAKKTETVAKPRPKTETKPRGPREVQVALAPPGMTSPFRYRAWNPAWNERYAPTVRDTEPGMLATNERRRGTQALAEPARSGNRNQTGKTGAKAGNGQNTAGGQSVAAAGGQNAPPVPPPSGSDAQSMTNPGSATAQGTPGTPTDKTIAAGAGTGQGGAGQGKAGTANGSVAGTGGTGQNGKTANGSGVLGGTGGGSSSSGQSGSPSARGANKSATAATGNGAGASGTGQPGAGRNNGNGQTAATGNGAGSGKTGQGGGATGNGGASGGNGQSGNGLLGGSSGGQGSSGASGKSGKGSAGAGNNGTLAGGGASGPNGAGASGGSGASGSGTGKGAGANGVLGGGNAGQTASGGGEAGTNGLLGGANGGGAGQNGKSGNGQGGTAAGGGQNGTTAGGGAGGGGTGAGEGAGGGEGNTGGTAAGGEGGGAGSGGGVGGSGLLSGVDFGPGAEAEGIAGETAENGDANGIDTGFVPAVGVSPNFPDHNAEQQNGIPGALVLPPLPPQGTETGKLNEPRPVKVARRAAPATPTQTERRTRPQTATAATSARPAPARARKPLVTVVGSASRRGSVPVTLVARGTGKARLGIRGTLATRPDTADPLAPVRPQSSRASEAQPDALSAPVPERGAKEKRVVNSRGVRSGTKNPLPPTPLPDSDAELGDGSGLKGEYYLGRNFEQFQFTRADKNLDLFWGGDRSPSPRLPIGADWSCRWWGRVQPRHSGVYTLFAVADDGVRVWVNHKLVIDDWTLHPLLEYSGQIRLEAGKQYDIRVDYFESGGPPASLGVYWESDKQQKEFIPEACLFYPLPGEKMKMEKYEKPRR